MTTSLVRWDGPALLEGEGRDVEAEEKTMEMTLLIYQSDFDQAVLGADMFLDEDIAQKLKHAKKVAPSLWKTNKGKKRSAQSAAAAYLLGAFAHALQEQTLDCCKYESLEARFREANQDSDSADLLEELITKPGFHLISTVMMRNTSVGWAEKVGFTTREDEPETLFNVSVVLDILEELANPTKKSLKVEHEQRAIHTQRLKTLDYYNKQLGDVA
jgi:hypothetical protein